MAFSLIMQSFLEERFYHYLYEYYPERAYDAVLTGFQLYAYQRGLRGAQRAIRDGAPLNFENYQKYREVVSTPEMKAIDPPSRSDKTLNEEEFVGRTYRCLTHDFFREVNAPKEVEQIFCRHIDSVNVHGFNPEIHYESVSTLYESGCCVQRALNPKYSADMKFGVRMPDAPPFPYIIANEYFSMSKVLINSFGETGQIVSQKVKEDFIKTYGQEDWNEIEQYKDADFNSPFIWPEK